MTWHPVDPPAHQLPDTARFLEVLEQHAGFFETGAPLVVARAPGRLDVMGGIADYSGALVLELPLGVAAFAAAQPAREPALTIRSLQAAAIGAVPEVTIALADLAPGGAPLEYGTARTLLAADTQAHWAAYVAGALVVLGRERGLTIDRGVRLLLDSQVPPGKGVSSSAAIEVAAMQAICALYGVDLPGRELAILCQKVENLVVGAPCGVMDQMTAACGRQDMLLALLCQPAELQAPIALPPDLEVWGIDSGIRHAVTGADYGSVRVGAFMGYRIMAEIHAERVSGRTGERVISTLTRSPAHPLTPPPAWGGYLANVTPSAWEQHYRAYVPETLGGAEFLARYGGTTDTVTQVDPARTYAVRQPAAHPIYEHHRVRLFRALLEHLSTDHRPPTTDHRPPTTEPNDKVARRQGDKVSEVGETLTRSPLHPFTPSPESVVSRPSSVVEEARELLGELMFQSHASYSACGLGSDGTDRLVELVRAVGPGGGLYGAKITGGGSGGTVAVLARRGSEPAIRALAARYEQETGHTTTLLSGSSPGAQAFGVIWLNADGE